MIDGEQVGKHNLSYPSASLVKNLYFTDSKPFDRAYLGSKDVTEYFRLSGLESITGQISFFGLTSDPIPTRKVSEIYQIPQEFFEDHH